VRARTRDLRDAADRVAAGELRAQEKAVIDDFDRILATRLELFRLKLSSKFARNLVSGAGTAAILLVGGWLVLQGRTDAGTIVASISGLARLEGPWRDLISFYRQAATIRVSFELIVDQFVADDAAADRPSPVAAGTGSPT
jgi:ABC-type bacteriocin/lantibiotic exporter with double-glycine peptidase domain